MPTLGTLSVRNGTLNFSTGSSVTISALNLTGGTLTGTDNITVSGVTTWSSQGTLSGASTLMAEGELNITAPSGSGFVTLNTPTLENFGTATFTGTGFIQMRAPPSLTNRRTWNLETEGLSVSSGSDTFNNEGTLNTTGSSGSM